MTSPDTIEAPNFNGMSREVFVVGNALMEFMDSIDNETAAEFRQRVVQEVINQALSRLSSDQQLEELITTLNDGLSQLSERQKMRQRAESAPMHIDLDY